MYNHSNDRSAFLPYEWITGKLGVSAATVNSIVKSGAAKLVSSESYRNPVSFSGIPAISLIFSGAN